LQSAQDTGRAIDVKIDQQAVAIGETRTLLDTFRLRLEEDYRDGVGERVESHGRAEEAEDEGHKEHDQRLSLSLLLKLRLLLACVVARMSPALHHHFAVCLYMFHV
jgi:hypothetical protein